MRRQVLVVDDEPTVGEVVSRYLERAGYAALIAHDGPSALAAVAEHEPDLVVLDLVLPGMDGLEVMRRIRETRDDRTAVIVLTALEDPSARSDGLQLGADDYLAKPFSPAALVARIDAVLGRPQPAAGPAATMRTERGGQP